MRRTFLGMTAVVATALLATHPVWAQGPPGSGRDRPAAGPEIVVRKPALRAANPDVIAPPPVLKIVVPVETVVTMPARHTVTPGRDRSWSSN